MDRQEIEKMRAQMMRFTDDINFVDKTIRRLIREEREAKAGRAGVGNPAEPPEATLEDEMRKGSATLLHAISLARDGVDPCTNRNLMWLRNSGMTVSNCTGANGYLWQPKEPAQRRDSRICFQCGTPAFKGCKHQQAAA